MSSRLGFLFLAAALSSATAGDSDGVSWIRADGAPGWSATIPHGIPKDATGSSPLLAPVWFAKLPDTKFQLAPTGSFELASARGKVLLLDYWASWCNPCIKELPHLQRLHAMKSRDGLVVLAVNADEGAAAAGASAKRIGLTMMIGLNDPDLYRVLSVKTLPTLLLIDKQGRLRMRWDGYQLGLENEIESSVTKLLADDPTGSTHEVATVLSGQGRLQAIWNRELVGSADGILGFPSGVLGRTRVVVSAGGELLSFDAAGEATERVKVTATTGRLLDFGSSADGTREVVGFRPGGTSVGVTAVRSGAQRTIGLPAPLLDVTERDGPGGSRRLVLATMKGVAQAAEGETRAQLIAGSDGARSVATIPEHGVVVLREDGTIRSLEADSPPWPQPAAGAERLIAARRDGVVVGPRSVVAAVSGRFLPGDGRQLAVATYSGHLTLLDEASGRVEYDASFTGIHDLAATDLDGDGRDELLVAAGHAVTALGAATH